MTGDVEFGRSKQPAAVGFLGAAVGFLERELSAPPGGGGWRKRAVTLRSAAEGQ